MRVAAIWTACDACASSGLVPDAACDLHKCPNCYGVGRVVLVMPLADAMRLTQASALARALRWAAA